MIWLGRLAALAAPLVDTVETVDETTPDRLAAWASTHAATLTELLSTYADTAGVSDAPTGEPFSRHVLTASPRGGKLALHVWRSGLGMAADGRSLDDALHVHNHVMPVSGVILTGELEQRCYPSLTLAQAIDAWLVGRPTEPPVGHAQTWPRGSSYMLPAEAFHHAMAATPVTCTLFVTGHPLYGGNVHVPRAGGQVRLKVPRPLAAAFHGLRGRGTVAQVLSLLKDTGTSGAPEVI